jgi:hypothetical protein
MLSFFCQIRYHFSVSGNVKIFVLSFLLVTAVLCYDLYYHFLLPFPPFVLAENDKLEKVLSTRWPTSNSVAIHYIQPILKGTVA